MSAGATADAPMSQHMKALRKANRTRLARAELKRQIRDGETTVIHVLETIPWEAESMAIRDLLTAQRRWGGTRARRLLARVPVLETKPIGDMTPRQRTTVAQLLEGEPVLDPITREWR